MTSIINLSECQPKGQLDMEHMARHQIRTCEGHPNHFHSQEREQETLREDTGPGRVDEGLCFPTRMTQGQMCTLGWDLLHMCDL